VTWILGNGDESFDITGNPFVNDFEIFPFHSALLDGELLRDSGIAMARIHPEFL